MGKKKNKITRLTDEQYYAYLAGLRQEPALFGADGKMIVPSPFDKSDNTEGE